MKTATMLAAVMANIAAPALAQEGEEGRAFSYPMGGPIPDGYPPPDYAYRGGEVYVDGDEVIGCDEFAPIRSSSGKECSDTDNRCRGLPITGKERA